VFTTSAPTGGNAPGPIRP